MEKGEHRIVAENTKRTSAEQRIRFLVEVAERNNSVLDLAELQRLMPAGYPMTQAKLRNFICRTLTDIHVSHDGFVFDGKVATDLDYVRKSKSISAERIEYARRFVEQHPKLFDKIQIVAVSGSTSYGSSGPQDDLDLMVVARDGFLWISILRLLVYLRAMRLSQPRSLSSRFCLSPIFTRSGLREFLRNSRNALTARDLLTLIPLKGGMELARIITENDWIREYYPQGVQSKKLEESQPREPPKAHPLERLCFEGLQRYLSLVAWARNAKLLRSGREPDLFRFKRSPDYAVYESGRYVELLKMYSSAF